MDIATFKSFKYEIALGNEVPLPEPKLDRFPHDQYSLQQFLRAACKEHVGALGKTGTKWYLINEKEEPVSLSKRADISLLLDFAVQMGIIEPKTADAGSDVFVPYQLSQAFWEKFDKFSA